MPGKQRQQVRERILAALTANHTIPDSELDLEKYPNRARARAVALAARRMKVIRELRAQAVVEQFEELKTERAPDPYVMIGDLRVASLIAIDGGGIEVHLDGGGGETHFRVFNPPTLVADSAGDIEISGRKYREDPLTALAAAIGVHAAPKRRNW